MASRKTWIWIIVGVVGFCLIALFAVAGFGLYYVSNHITAKSATAADAQKAFDAVRETFKGRTPLIEIDSTEHARIVKPLAELPSAATKPVNLEILVWDPDDEKIVRVNVPFWIVRFTGNKMNLGSRGGFDLDRLKLDVKELERIGSSLVLDYKAPTGERVLIWTQ